jgi:hypothetical protein
MFLVDWISRNRIRKLGGGNKALVKPVANSRCGRFWDKPGVSISGESDDDDDDETANAWRNFDDR